MRGGVGSSICKGWNAKERDNRRVTQPSCQRIRESKQDGDESACNMKMEDQVLFVGQSEGGGGRQE